LKIQSSQKQLFRTFVFYLVIIAVPLGVLVYQESSSLEKYRFQLEANKDSALRDVGEDVYRDLREEWAVFLEREMVRDFTHYQPVVIPDASVYQGEGIGTQRSPLYAETVVRLKNLEYKGKFFGRNPLAKITAIEGRSSSPSLEQIFHNSLVGYFQYNVGNGVMTTPYDPDPAFQEVNQDTVRVEQIRKYRQFLTNTLEQQLLSHILAVGETDLEPRAVLRYLKKQRVSKQKIILPIKPGQKGTTPPSDLPSGLKYADASFYEYNFFSFHQREEVYVICFRPVLLEQKEEEEQILIQGFLFNTVPFIQEAQAYLEPLQPGAGSMVVQQNPAPLYNVTHLFDPFDAIGLVPQYSDKDDHLATYHENKRRFWFVMTLLLVALSFSLFHMGKMMRGQMELFRNKNNFISAITHELKAPLTSIIMYAEMLEEGWAKGKEQTYYHYIHWESQRLTRLIKNILDYSGLERGSFVFNPSCFVLHEFVEKSLEPLEAWTDKNGLNLDVRVIAEPEVEADKDSVAQVIYNLCDNTIKYGMAADTPTMVIEIKETATMGVLLVYDNGPGISKEEEGRIFERFYRCENEMTRERTGTGLGLALVKELIEGNGGEVQPLRPEGGGFGVRILIPKVPITALAAVGN